MIKSNPGTTDSMVKKFPSLKLSFVPEFLRERCAIIDFVENHDIALLEQIALNLNSLAVSWKSSQKFVKTSPIEAELSNTSIICIMRH